MQESIPVPDLMHGRAAGVVLRERAPVRHRAAQHVAAIQHVDVRGSIRRDAALGQAAVAQQHGARGHAGRPRRGLEERLEVDV